MNKLISFLLLSLCMYFDAHAQDHCDNQCQIRLIESYYTEMGKILTKGSTTQDISNFLESLHPQVNYLHPEYNADFDAERWRKAFSYYLNAGRYNNPKEAVTTINKIIHGLHFAAVEKIDRHFNEETGKIIESPPRLALFGFKEGKINYIRDYWHHSIE